MGYGLIALPASIDRVWMASGWEMWIDVESVGLAAFRFSDRCYFISDTRFTL